MKRRIVLSLLSILLIGFGIVVNSLPANAMSQVILGGYADALSKTGTEYNAIMGGQTWTSTMANRYDLIPTGGKISRLYIELSDVPGTNPYLFTIMIDGLPSSLTATVAPDATTASNTSVEVDVTAGQTICLRSSRPSGNPSNTPNCRWSVVFAGTNSNESIYMGIGLAAVAATNAFSVAVASQGSGGSGDTKFQIAPTGGTLRDLYVLFSVDAGTNPDAYDVMTRLNVANTTLSVTLVADNITGHNTTDNVTVVAGDRLTINIVPKEIPSASPTVSWGLVFSATTDGESMILGYTSDFMTNSQVEYNSLQTSNGATTWTTTESTFYQCGQSPPNNLVLSDFYIYVSTAPTAGKSWDIAVRANTSNTTITAKIVGTSKTGSNTTASYTVGDFDDLAIMQTPTDSPTTGVLSWGLLAYIAAGSPSLTNSPSVKNFNSVNTTSTYYAKGTAPNNPVADGDCTFTVTNDGSIAIDVAVHGHAFTGGGGWTLTSGSPGSDTVRITTYYSGQNPASGVVVTTSDQPFISNITASGTKMWDFKLETGTFTDGSEKTSTLTLTATAH